MVQAKAGIDDEEVWGSKRVSRLTYAGSNRDKSTEVKLAFEVNQINNPYLTG